MWLGCINQSRALLDQFKISALDGEQDARARIDAVTVFLGEVIDALACRHVFGNRCASLGTQLAGKTGTPSFGFDRLTLAQARQHCRANPRDEDCAQKPIKLYVAAVRSADYKSAGHDKVIAVTSERNWYLADRKLPAGQRDRVQGAINDLDNVAAEIAMRVVAEAWLAPARR